jgi:hypothetical protein
LHPLAKGKISIKSNFNELLVKRKCVYNNGIFSTWRIDKWKRGTVSAAVFQKIVKDTVLQHHVRRVVESFRTTKSVLKSAGRPQEIQNIMEYVEALVEGTPQT